MQKFDTAAPLSGAHVDANDLGPLAWVLDELRKSLDTATKALRRYVRDAEQARGSDLAAVDTGQLRISRQQLHQAVGALEMVGFVGPAVILRSMETAVQKFITRPELCTEEAAIKIERAGFGLTGYLETVLAGKSQSPVVLFVQYAEVQEIAGASRVHPADLWPYAWRWMDVADTGVAPIELNAESRMRFDKAALTVIKLFDLPSALELAGMSAAMANPVGLSVGRQYTMFWRIAAGFFEAIATGALLSDVYVKRTVSRILIQLATHIKGDMAVSDRLAQDLLFFCAQAKPQGLAPLLGEVRLAYGLAQHPPVDYSKSVFGQFDPALLVQARKRITTAKESWSSLAAGEMSRTKAVQDQFSLIVDSITKLLPSGQALSLSLTGVADEVAKTGHAPEPALGMEVATSILYLEAGFEDFDPADPTLTDRMNHLADRVEKAREGATNQALEPWMEELYRRVSDRQTMGSVVGELKNSLAELEKCMDQFFRDPQDKAVLTNVPTRLAQMRGVLSVLGLDHATHAVLRMRESIEQILVTEIDDVRARAAGTFDKIGNNLGALGFLIDMLSYQPVLAKKLFVFDEDSGELKPLMGRVNTPIPLTEVSHDAVEAPHAAQAPVAATQQPAVSAAPVAAVATAAVAAVAAGTTTTATPTAPAVVDSFDDDAEMREIFLEEAREVVGNGQAALAVLAVEPSNAAEMTTLRRAFHTLKGSSRMVGLNNFGEAGWSLEQLMNAWIADQKPVDDALRNTATQSLTAMASWIEDIATGQAQSWSSAPFRASADALRLHGQFLALQLDAPSASEPAASVPAALAPVVAVVAAVTAAVPAIASVDAGLIQPIEMLDSLPDITPSPEFDDVLSTAAPQAAEQTADLADFTFDLDQVDKPTGSELRPVVDEPLSDISLDLDQFDIATDSAAQPAVSAEPSAEELSFELDLADESTITDHGGQSVVELAAMDVPAPAADLSLPVQAQDEAAIDFGFDELDNQDLVVMDGMVLDAAESEMPDLDQELAAPVEQAMESGDELISAEELAAFERAMREHDALELSEAADAASPAFVQDMGNAAALHQSPAPEPVVPEATAPEVLPQGALPPEISVPQTDGNIAAPADFIAHTKPMPLVREETPDPAFDLGFDLGDFAKPAAAVGSVAAASVAFAGAASYTPAAQAVSAPTSMAAALNSSMAALSSADDQYKAIGPLRISLPLYNVYLNEADEWSRRLITSLGEWALEPHQALPNDAVVFAHSLAGSSATVGFSALSGLARQMEDALLHVQSISEDGSYSAHAHAADFTNGAEEVRRLLHQFAAGLLREPLAEVQQALQRCMRAPEPTTEFHALTAAPADSGFINLDGNTPEVQVNTAQAATDSVAFDVFDHPVDQPSSATAAPAARASSWVDLPIAASLNASAATAPAVPSSPAASGFMDLDQASSVTVIATAGGSSFAALQATPDPVLSPAAQPSAYGPLEAAHSASAELAPEPAAVEPVIEPVAAPVVNLELPVSGFQALHVSPAVSRPAELKPIELNSPVFEAFQPAPSLSTFAALGIERPGMVAPHALGVVPRNLSDDETEDEIDVEDALDPDLFPIFEEEALELFPQLEGALRQWTSRPSNTSARGEVLRGLHTLKGSSRLAGALRLGELAHRMESAIEQNSEEATTEQLEPLTALLDGMQANFERIRHPAAPEVAATPQAAPVAAAVAVAAAEANTSASASVTTTAKPAMPSLTGLTPLRVSPLGAVSVAGRSSNQTVRVRSQLLDRLVNQAGEVMITRSRLEAELGQLRGSLGDLSGNLDKLRLQLRDIEVQSESQMQSRMALAKETSAEFDPLEFDRFTRVQELTRMMAESVNDVATVQRSIQRTVEATEDDLVAQARQTRDLQRDLLRTRMVEFEGISERLYRVVRQAGKDAGKQVKLDILGGSIEMDRGVLDRMTPAFEHLLRNCVAHGIEETEARVASGKDGSGLITISLGQEGNDVSVEFRDDGAGLNLQRIRERAVAQGLLTNGQQVEDSEAANLIFTPGFTTATQVTELSGRGIGMDVVRSEVYALGGRIETSTSAGHGTSFKLVLPLTTAVTQVVMLRIGKLAVGVPANLVEIVRRATPKDLQAAYNTGGYEYNGETLPFFWSGALLQHSRASDETPGKSIPILVFRSAAQRIVAHVDEVLGNQEVVVKNLGPQLSRLPGLAGMSVLASGAVALIYNPVALAAVYGEQARTMSADRAESHVLAHGAITDVVARDLSGDAAPVVPLVPSNPMSVSAPQIPLVLVVDDSITVRRITQRLLQREGYRVALAADGLQALERLAEELPSVILSDIEMPRMDGFDLARNIKADPRLAVLPIIMITSRIAEKHREHAMSLGVNHYLGKPYSEEELMSLVRRYTATEIAL
jgi:chemosensory pili system protein ChpA (sensor histidine kinase/response regulator)